MVLWQEEVWTAIVRAASDTHPKRVAYNWRDELSQRAASQHTASSPDLLRGLTAFNRDKEYPDRAKPFGFMLWFYARRKQDWISDVTSRSDWNPRERQWKPASPYRRSPSQVPPELIRDRETEEIVPLPALRTYADMLRAYHRSPESKFIGGGGNDLGPLRRRHVKADGIFYIGKESDPFDQSDEFGEEEDRRLYELKSTPASLGTSNSLRVMHLLRLRCWIGRN